MLNLATKANIGYESTIDDFAKDILRVLGYKQERIVMSCHPL